MALTFSYDFPEAVELHSEYEVLAALEILASFPAKHAYVRREVTVTVDAAYVSIDRRPCRRLCLPCFCATLLLTARASHVQRFRPVLTRAFAEDLRSRGVDVTAIRIEPGQPPLTVTEMAYVI